MVRTGAMAAASGGRLHRGELPARLVSLGVIVAVALLLHLVPATGRSPGVVGILAISVAFAAAQMVSINLPLGGDRYVLDVSEVPLLIALAIADPVIVVLARLAGEAVAFLVDRPPPKRWVFNLAQGAMEVSLAAALWHLMGGMSDPDSAQGIAALGLAVVISMSIGTIIVGVVISMVTGQSQAAVVRSAILATTITASYALIVVGFVTLGPILLPFLIAPGGLIFYVIHSQGETTRHYDELRAVDALSQQLALRPVDETDESLAQVVLQIRSAIAADRALLLIEGGSFEGAHRPGDEERDPVIEEALLSVASDMAVPANTPTIASGSRAQRLVALGIGQALVVHFDRESISGSLVLARSTTLRGYDKRSLDLAAMLCERLVTHLTQRALELEQQRRSRFDELTGSLNRAGFEAALTATIDADEDDELTVAMIGIDRFREINDSLGHDVGDDLLRTVAGCLRRRVGESGSVARYSGDQFCILFRRDTDAAQRLVRSVIDSIGNLTLPGEVQVHVTVTAGLASVTGTAVSAEIIPRQAEIAMYHAKRKNMRTAVYDDDLDHQSASRLQLADELRAAVHSGQLEVWFQPKLDLGSRMVVGVEALVRWLHPERGYVPPDVFVPVAERGGFIRELSNHVTSRALGAIRSWRDAGLDLTAAVNLSARDLLDPSLPRRFSELLSQHGLSGSSLRVEITETMAMTDRETSLRVLRRLSEMGIGIAVDDYGTGYSSLSYLTDLPIDEIKIDRRFVAAMADDPRSETIVRSTVRLGHDLGFVVVAEGVETEDGINRLASMGCDLIQGYAVARPVTDQTLLSWLLDTDQPFRAPAWPGPFEGSLDGLLEPISGLDDDR